VTKINSEEVLGEGKWLRLRKQGKWEWIQRVNTTGVCGLYAFTDADEVVLVEQPRPPLDNARVLEIPAGLVGDIVGQEDEANELAAHRELIEETGYEAGVLRHIVEVPSCAGITEETIMLYVARELKKVGPGGGDDSEDIEVHVVPMAEFGAFIQERIKRGVWIDPKVFAVPFFHGL
tara:strand:+ start:94044 stop:94574 length:531 start_codon:yes stop_codon:yes gene_type:complete